MDEPALLPRPCMGAFVWRAKLTFKTFPFSSFKSMLSIASWASSGAVNVTKANPRCFAPGGGMFSTVRGRRWVVTGRTCLL